MLDEPYPESAKMLAVKEQSQVIGEFLDSSKYVLAEYVTVTYPNMLTERRHTATELRPVVTPIEQILAAYFEIDLDKVEEEKRAMLAALRGESR